MKVETIGKNIEVTQGIREAVQTSIERVEKYFKDKEIEAKVLVRTYPIGTKVEATVIVDKTHIIRQEESHDDLYAAIDLVGKKLDKQIRKIKERMARDAKRQASASKIFADYDHEKSEKINEITRRKVLENKPMTEEEAILQFELVGHDFFVFDDYEVELTKILYKRKDGEYGIIELDA